MKIFSSITLSTCCVFLFFFKAKRLIKPAPPEGPKLNKSEQNQTSTRNIVHSSRVSWLQYAVIRL